MYFDQFLAWFGASMMSGTFVNVIDAIDNPKAATPGDSSSLTKKPEFIKKKRTIACESIHLTHIGNSVQLSLPEIATWTIYDMKGHKVASAYGREFLWNNGNKGVYTVTAQSAKARYTRKVVLN